jgi:hypothetical protein
MGALNSTSPIQNSAGSPTSPSGDINDTKISAETTPKPRKFFKSRNAAPPAEIQQQIAIQQQMAMQQQMSQQHSNHVQSSPEDVPIRTSPKKQTQKKQPAPKKEKVVKPKVEKLPKEKKVKAPKVKEVVPMMREDSSESDDEPLSPPRRGRQLNNETTRHSGRVRGKINYNEEEGEAEFIMRTEKRIAPKQLKLLQQQQQKLLLQQQQQQQEEQIRFEETVPIPSLPMDTQNHSEPSSPAINHPPIVLRISKVSF